ncbi:MAG: hypothetical protein R3B71_02200 [Candidatus Gracilibacteria bacterium]
MALLAEQIVEEWLNRQGYFTIRGIKLGVDEVDILAIRPSSEGLIECRHFEVQCSMRPVGYISNVSKEVRKLTGIGAGSAKKRTLEELSSSVDEWIEKKFLSKKKTTLKKSLCLANWSMELVINVVRSNEEVDLMKKRGIKVHHLNDVIHHLSDKANLIKSAANDDLSELILVGRLADKG